MTMGSLCLVWSSFVVLCFVHSRTFPCPLPLLLSKPCFVSHKTNFFLNLPHNLIITCTHIPCIIPFPSPLFLGIHNPCTTDFYYSSCISSMPSLEASILIDNFNNNKNLPISSLNNSLSASLYDLVVSTTKSMI